MDKLAKIIGLVFLALALAGASAWLSSSLAAQSPLNQPSVSPPPSPVNLTKTSPSSELPDLVDLPSLANLAERIKPAVVNIFASKTVSNVKGPVEIERDGPPLPPDGFMDDYSERPRSPESPNPKSRPKRENSPPAKERVQGSGFVIDPEGFIITNDHVVEGAGDITVKFVDGREVIAQTVGRDPKTDLALLRLTESGPYPFITLGDSSQTQIGDWVLAIGNPFGLEHTVTKGIVSAQGRVIGASQYDDFIQTDASINPGNSGGPLLNLKGEVVGVNAMIFAGGEGIGFSIPSSLVKKIVARLKAHGYVERGFIGAVVQPLTSELATIFGLPNRDGALVADVVSGAPANKAGVKAGDVIVEFNGKPIKGIDDLTALASDAPIGEVAKVALVRDQKRLTLDLTMGRLDEPVPDTGPSVYRGLLDLGLTLREITPAVAEKLEGVTSGLLVEGIQEVSPAKLAGVEVRDIILEVDRRPVKTLEEYNAALRAHRHEDPVVLWLKRGDIASYLFIPLD
ncbi:MAG: Do family serine endopeptidase [Deltaproteobacteria bacterium]|jgi:serine protease Do|nr:Do family serine endopeptidase [Deltaproteobacteria bacterium]